MQLTKRVNQALSLLGRRLSRSKVISVLMRKYRVSHRQADRYVSEAQKAKQELPIPERKIVFTVKLPLSLVRRLRALASSTGESLSAVVTRALEAFLGRGRHGSKKVSK